MVKNIHKKEARIYMVQEYLEKHLEDILWKIQEYLYEEEVMDISVLELEEYEALKILNLKLDEDELHLNVEYDLRVIGITEDNSQSVIEVNLDLETLNRLDEFNIKKVLEIEVVINEIDIIE